MSVRATDFIIWRAGDSVDWVCTQEDLAEETGFSIETVQRTLKRRGWRCRSDRNSGAAARPPVDRLMTNNITARRHEGFV